eukprot:3716570-Karenia_brevis.AAC.1
MDGSKKRAGGIEGGDAELAKLYSTDWTKAVSAFGSGASGELPCPAATKNKEDAMVEDLVQGEAATKKQEDAMVENLVQGKCLARQIIDLKDQIKSEKDEGVKCSAQKALTTALVDMKMAANTYYKKKVPPSDAPT